jgi:hemerythrin superfamily protein
MNAIDLLTSQHRKVQQLFAQIATTDSVERKLSLFETLADNLAIHVAIEEHQFYPMVKANRTEGILLSSLEEHLGMKRVLADLLKVEVEDTTFAPKLKVLNEIVEHHVEEEERDLFPKVTSLLGQAKLETLGQEMVVEASELDQAGAPRMNIPTEIDESQSL